TGAPLDEAMMAQAQRSGDGDPTQSANLSTDFSQRLFKALKYAWAGPTTMVGLAFLYPTLLTGGKAKLVDGVLEIQGGAAGFFLHRCTLLPGGATVMTLGHVVLGRDELALDLTRDHERVHVKQCERWGPFFLPAYLLASAVVYLRGGQAYRDNPFECEAFDTA